jgi:A/G-specific adenine glycosylase
MENEYAEKLVEWFKSSKRDLPWRKNRSAYSVLVSEIMLQQTKASAVIPYYIAWMEKFPDFESLAKASKEEVIKMWEGLGYYSRAKNLHQIAVLVVEKFNGTFPDNRDDILSFKGVGPYTSSAILHFAFNKRGVGADGNIKKVIARFFGFNEIITKDNKLLPLLDSFLPKVNAKDCFEGLIELGATICGKKPLCHVCPLSSGCVAYHENLTSVLPVVKKREKITVLFRIVFVIEKGSCILIAKEEGKLMNGLYAFPYIQTDEKFNLKVAKKQMEEKFGFKLLLKRELFEVSHTFTRYKANLKPYYFTLAESDGNLENFLLVEKDLLHNYPFSSGFKQILKNLNYTLAS